LGPTWKHPGGTHGVERDIIEFFKDNGKELQTAMMGAGMRQKQRERKLFLFPGAIKTCANHGRGKPMRFLITNN
jgi:hypothetical protein